MHCQIRSKVHRTLSSELRRITFCKLLWLRKEEEEEEEAEDEETKMSQGQCNLQVNDQAQSRC